MYEWELLQDDQRVAYAYDEQIGVLVCNSQSSIIVPPASGVLGILLSHADTPVTQEDFYEAAIGVRSPHAVKKAIRELTTHPVIGAHILQVGSNKRAVYSFLTNPNDDKLLKERMQDVHYTLHGKEDKSDIAKKHTDTIRKVGIAATALATIATTYAVVRHVRKK